MTQTRNYGIAYLVEGQARKHVTVNDALARLDALAQPVVLGVIDALPTAGVAEGDAWLIGPAAGGDLAVLRNTVAVSLNGLWTHVPPREGWRLWLATPGRAAVYQGGAWVQGHLAGSPQGAATMAGVTTLEVTLTPGASFTTPPILADKAIVLGITGRVRQTLGGVATWSLGVPGSPDRYGSGHSPVLDAVSVSLTGQPQTYYAPTPVVLTAQGGSFTGGRVALSVHTLTLVA